MDQLALLFALLLGAVVSVPLGDRWGLPAPVLMTLLGIVLAVLDFVPNVNIPPDLILPLLLPPLLYAAVRRTSWRQFTANKRPIFLLAVALVFVTTLCVAAVAHAIVPGLTVAAAVALGALVGEDERREAHEQRMRRLKLVRRIQGEMLSAARHEVVAARSEPGVDPEIVDRVLRYLDVRSLR